MRVSFEEIPEKGLRLTITDQSWFPDRELNRSGPVTADLFLERIGISRVLARGRIETSITFECDRCLEETTLPLSLDFVTDLEVADKESEAVVEQDHTCSESEMDVVFIEEPMIDVFHLLEQQMFLSLPQKKLCSENCKGLCSKCGKNLNRDDCRCSQGEKFSPFSALANLKR